MLVVKGRWRVQQGRKQPARFGGEVLDLRHNPVILKARVCIITKENHPMKKTFVSACAIAVSSLVLVAQTAPQRTPLANLDARTAVVPAVASAPEKSAAAESLRRAVPGLKVEFERVSGAPKNIFSTEGFLTGPDGKSPMYPA